MAHTTVSRMAPPSRNARQPGLPRLRLTRFGSGVPTPQGGCEPPPSSLAGHDGPIRGIPGACRGSVSPRTKFPQPPRLLKCDRGVDLAPGAVVVLDDIQGEVPHPLSSDIPWLGHAGRLTSPARPERTQGGMSGRAATGRQGNRPVVRRSPQASAPEEHRGSGQPPRACPQPGHAVGARGPTGAG